MGTTTSKSSYSFENILFEVKMRPFTLAIELNHHPKLADSIKLFFEMLLFLRKQLLAIA
uniref:Uncharacterized protein n=1 Tax=Anguilla anguilla TaxID=7936 RepID=A0A0E9RA66_ANGAN